MNHEKICRVCLNSDQGNCTRIFNKSNETFIYEKLNLIANINIKPKDGLPDKICSDCLSELENAILFKQKCETSNNILISALHINIGLPKQKDEILKVPVKEEYDEYTEDGHFEEEPPSPPELILDPNGEPQKPSLQERKPKEEDGPMEEEDQKGCKSEELDEQEPPKNSTEIHLEPPSRPNTAIDLKLECHDCGAFFKSKCKLRVHWFRVHLKAQLTCNNCGNTFDSLEHLNNHKINRTKRCVTLGQVRIDGEGKSRVYHCKECVYSTKYILAMTKHLAVHSREQLSTHKLALKPQELNEREQPLNPPKIHLVPPFRPSRAIDLHLQCHDCGAFFKSKCKLRVHWFRVHLKAQLTCNICGNTFGSFENLNDHKINRTKRCVTMGQVHAEGEGKSQMYHCKECVYSTKYIGTMAKHLAVHSGERGYACTLCPATYTYRNSFEAHMESKHGVIRKTVVCNICGETLGNRAFYSHIRKHKAGDFVKCNICNKVLKYKSSLKVHMERHVGVKKYACDKCGKLFTTGNSLYKHRSVHERKHDIYSCNVCEFTIHDRKRMYKHKLNHSKYYYVCTKCGKFFENATQLSCHVERHNDNYRCPQCEKTFFTRKILVRHMNKVHKISAKTGNKILVAK